MNNVKPNDHESKEKSGDKDATELVKRILKFIHIIERKRREKPN